MPTPSLVRMEVPTHAFPSPSSHAARPDDASRLQLALALRARDGRLVAAAYAALAGDGAHEADAPDALRPAPDRAQLSLFAR